MPVAASVSSIPRLRGPFPELRFLLDRRGPATALTGEVTRTDMYPGGLVRLQPPGRTVVCAWRAEHCKQLFDVQHFDKDIEGPLRRLRAFAGDGLFTAETTEPNWMLAHKLLMPAFTRPSMRRYFPLMQEVLDALVASWTAQAACGEAIDVRADMSRLTLDTISLCGFGYRFRSFDHDELHPFLQAMGRSLAEAGAQLARPRIVDAMMFARRARARRDIATMNALVDDVIRNRRVQGGGDRDLLDLMVQARDEHGVGLSDENIRYQILTFLIAGHETTSNLLSFALRALWLDPALRARCVVEADEKLPDVPTFDDVERLDLIPRVLAEALRLWPPAPAIGVQPLHDVEVGGHTIPAGMRVLVLLPALHRDPAAWKRSDDDDVERFDPDRFLPDAERRRPPSAYRPFGNGRRACIGRQFALVEAELALATILRRFDLVELHGATSGVDEQLAVKPAAFALRVRPRTPVASSSALSSASPAPSTGAARETAGRCPLHALLPQRS